MVGEIASGCSRLYAPHRALGVVTDGTPLSVKRLGRTNFATASAGRSFLVFHCDRLQVGLVSRLLPRYVGGGGREHGGGVIRAMASRRGRLTFLACGKDIAWYNRMDFCGRVGAHPGDVLLLLSVGDWLVSACEGGRLRSWAVNRLGTPGAGDDRLRVRDDGDENDNGNYNDEDRWWEPAADIALPAGFIPSAMCHPPTYLNKVLVGSSSGSLVLCNIRAGRIVHKFANLSIKLGNGITALQPSPALDVAAVGTASGKVYIVNLREDAVLFTLKQRSKVTALSFRTDAVAASQPTLLSAGSDGVVHTWDLKKRRLSHSMKCHEGEGGVASAEFLLQEPILITSGAIDNSIRMWVFDSPDGSGRILRSREGHSGPPRVVRYYGASATVAVDSDAVDPNSLCLLSAGSEGALRVFHTVRDCLATELSQKALSLAKGRVDIDDVNGLQVRRRLKPALDFAISETRGREWCDVISCHENDSAAYTWRFQSRAASKHILRQPGSQSNPMMSADDISAHVSSVAISSCGNFAFVGNKGGWIHRYNMQSGQCRGSYPSGGSAKKVFAGDELRPGSVSKIAATNSGRRDHAIGGKEEKICTPAKVIACHTATVSGLVTDALDRFLLSAGLDGRLVWWSLTSHDLLYSVEDLPPVSILRVAKDAALVAVACDDAVVRLFDIESKRIVRRLVPRQAVPSLVNDMCFTSDCRRLATVCVDGSLRVWDLPTGRCIDWMSFAKPAVGVTCSPSGEFMCTSHAGTLGLSIWADRSFFEPVFLDTEPLHPSLMEEPNPEPELDVGGGPNADAEVAVESDDKSDRPLVWASTSGRNGNLTELASRLDKRSIKGAFCAPNVADEDQQHRAADETYGNEESVSGIKLSLLPHAYWLALYNLDEVKERNRPIQPPSKPAEAPFFLPTLHKHGAVEPTFAENEEELARESKRLRAQESALQGWGVDGDDTVWEDQEGEEDQDEDSGGHGDGAYFSSRILHLGGNGNSSVEEDLASRCTLASLLVSGTSPSDIMHYLKGLGPSAVDIEMSQLCTSDVSFDAGAPKILGAALDFFAAQIASEGDFDVLQAYINRFLRLHADAFASLTELQQSLAQLLESQLKSAGKLKQLLQEDLCLLAYVRG